MAEGMYQADGTIHVRFGRTSSVVTFIPDKYVEQGGSKFVVFVPWEGDGQKSNANGDGKGKARKSDCEVEIDGSRCQGLWVKGRAVACRKSPHGPPLLRSRGQGH